MVMFNGSLEKNSVLFLFNRCDS